MHDTGFTGKSGHSNMFPQIPRNSKPPMTADGKVKENKKTREKRSLPKPFISTNLMTKLPIASITNREASLDAKLSQRSDLNKNPE